MKNNFYLLLFVVLFLLAGCKDKPVYMFSYFGSQSYGLKLAYSKDGYHFTEAYKSDSTPFLAPQLGKNKLLRDPSILKGKDGLFHMVWTTGWNDNIIGHASSKDLVNWSEQQVIPVMTHEPEVINSWAPELYYDEPSDLYYIFWASSIPGRHNLVPVVEAEAKYNHRIYAVTTKDFKEYSKTFLFFNPDDFLAIDAAIVKSPIDGAIIMTVKNENSLPPEKNIRISRRINDDGSLASSLTEGKWSEVSEPISPEGVWSEGPTPFFTGDTLNVYYDEYVNRAYGLSRSTDNGNTWEVVDKKFYSFPLGEVRHGTVFKISQNDFENFLNALQLKSLK